MKKLQQLRAKKGFTLVELIVVIAIIGVLAAILIPTMIGYVKSANITSADQTAASIRKEISNTISQLESKGCTTTGDGLISLEISNTTGADASYEATYPASFDDPAPGNNDNEGRIVFKGKWTADDGTLNDYTWDNDVKPALEETLAKDLKEVKSGVALIVIKNGVCVQAAYSADTFSHDATDGVKAENYDENEEGIIDGVIVGTNPKVYKATASNG